MQELRFVKGEVIQLAAGLMLRIAKTVCYPSLTASVVSVLKRFTKIDKADCWEESSLDSLTLLLSTPTLQSWTVDQVNLECIGNLWQQLANTAGQGSIISLTVGSQSQYVKKRWKQSRLGLPFFILTLLMRK